MGGAIFYLTETIFERTRGLGWKMSSAELEFEQQAFVELLSEDGLIVLARCVFQPPLSL